MTKYVISGYIGFDNFGDEAIVKVLTSHLKNLNAEKITVLSSNPEKTAKLYDVFSVNFLKFIQPIVESDVLISGGGSLLQDVTSLKSLIYYLAVIVTALVFNKKVVIFAQGFTPFRTFWGEFFTKFVLKYCHKIYVRDEKSFQQLLKMGINSEIISDPVFDFEIKKNENKKGVGVQLRSFSGLNDKFLKNLAEEIIKNFPNQEIKLFSLQDSLDLETVLKFAEILKENNQNCQIYQKMDIEEVITKISEIEYFIGMRFHSCLIASKAGAKVLGINYDIKVKNLSEKVGFPILELKEDSIDEKIQALKNIDITKYQNPKFEMPEL